MIDVIDIPGTDSFSLGELRGGGAGKFGKIEKRGIFNLRTGDQISMKFDIY